MQRKLEDLPNWTLDIEERSAGVYKLRALHDLGASIELSGTDPDELIQRVRKDALELERNLKTKIVR